MAFCSNCGSSITELDKFCGSCGTLTGKAQNSTAAPQQPNFQQNAQPNFQQNSQINFQQPPYVNFQQGAHPNFGPSTQQYVPHQPSAFSIAMGQLGKELINFIKNPIGTITKVKFEMTNLATYVFAGIMALLLILQNFWGAGQIKARFDISRPSYGSIFLTSMFFVIIMAAVLWALSLLINAVIMKGGFNPLHALNIVALVAIPYFIFSTVSVIFNYIDVNVGQIIYLSGLILSIVLYYRALGANVNKPENTLIYFFIMVPAILYLVNFIIFKVAGGVSVFFYGVFKGIM